MVNIGQHWSTLVNIGQRHAQCPAKVLQRIADWRLLELKQSWRGYVMHLLESMIINDHPTSTLHTTPCHHLQINQIHSKTFRDTSNQYGKIFQAYATQHRHLQRGSCFVQLADLLRQPATSATWSMAGRSMAGRAGRAGRATGLSRRMSQGNLHDICTTSARHLRNAASFALLLTARPSVAKAGQGRPGRQAREHKQLQKPRIITGSYGVDRCTLGTWRPLCAKCSTGSSNLSAGMEIGLGTRLARNSKVQMQKRYKPLKSLAADCFGTRMQQTVSFENKLFLAH